MERFERKYRNEKSTPPAFGLFKGFENNPPKVPERFKNGIRPGSNDYIVDWQMSDKQEEKRQIS
jgi:hypothetical protein